MLQDDWWSASCQGAAWSSVSEECIWICSDLLLKDVELSSA